MGEGWLGPSVEPRGFEAAAGIVGTAPPGPPSLPSWDLRPRSCSAWWLGGISCSCADLGNYRAKLSLFSWTLKPHHGRVRDDGSFWRRLCSPLETQRLCVRNDEGIPHSVQE